MNEIIESATETCPECGRPILYGKCELAGATNTVRLQCQCVTEREERERAAHIEAGRNLLREHLRAESGLSKRAGLQRFDSFRPDEGQAEAFQAAQAFVKAFLAGKNAGEGLLLAGGVGCGKSHLAAAIVNEIVDNLHLPDNDAEMYGKGITPPALPRSPVRFVSTLELLERLRAAYNSGENPQGILRPYKEAKLLILDDLGAEKPSEWVQERLFEIIDRRYNDCAPVVITTNANMAELGGKLGDRTCDRLREMCAAYPVTSKSHRRTADNAKEKEEGEKQA